MATTTLPPLYARWMGDLLGVQPAGEPAATCGTCAMVAKGPDDPGKHFRADIKCCSFMPKLPNFLVGRILADPTLPEGAASVRARIAKGTSVTPLGLGCPPEFSVAYTAANQNNGFGEVLSLRCPHYLDRDGGICGIWTHREAVCSTWFCRHSRGAAGRHLWYALQQLLCAVEDVVARACADALGAKRGWGDWAGRPEELYHAAGEHAGHLTWQDIQRLGAFALRFRVHMVREAWRGAQETGVPPTLVPGRELARAPLPEGDVRAWGYSNYDPIDLPIAVSDAIDRFDGRPVQAVLEDLASAGLTLDEALLQRLFDLRVLDLPPDA